MKKNILWLLLLVGIGFGLRADDSSPMASKSEFRFASKDFSNFTDSTLLYFTEPGRLDYIIIDSTGTDTSYAVDIVCEIDSVDYTLTTISCSSASEPYNIVLTSEDINGNLFGGLPVAGNIKVRVYNGAGLSACKVILIGKFPWRTN